MNRTDYILTITKGILEAPEECLEELINYFGAIFILNEPKKLGFVSLAASLDNGKDVSFVDWVQLLRSEKINKCFIRSISQTSDQLPAHIAAAFAGTQEYFIEIITEKTTRCYSMQSFYSSRYAITPDLFASLIDAQKNKEELWVLIAKLISDSNEMNGREAVDKLDVLAYLNTNEGKEVFDFLISNIIEEVQIELIVSGTPFIFPDDLKQLFYQFDSPFGDDAREIAFLYPLKSPSADQLIELVDAQTFSESVWEGCQEELKVYPIPELPIVIASEFEMYIRKQTIDHLESSGLTNIVCRVICSICEQNQIRPFIPENLKDYFGPNKKEYDKALVRYNSKDKWYLKSNDNSWEVCYYELLPVTTLLEPSVNFLSAKKDFSEALFEIENYAKQIQSPFEEAFRLAQYFLTGIVPVGNYDQQHLEFILQDLLKKGFSERSIDVLKNNFRYLEEWYKLKFDQEAILGLFAVNNANHFGGMGSWNDQYIENDPEIYETISAKTYATMKNYFVAILST